MLDYKREARYYALTDFDLSYAPIEFDYTVQKWKEGVPVPEIHEQIKKKFNHDRSIEEIILLLFDLSYNGLIKKRKGGLLGWVKEEE